MDQVSRRIDFDLATFADEDDQQVILDQWRRFRAGKLAQLVFLGQVFLPKEVALQSIKADNRAGHSHGINLAGVHDGR